MGYQERSDSGGEVQWPPEGSGFRLMPTLPYCSTHLTSSGMQVAGSTPGDCGRSEEHTSELQSHLNLVCRLLLEKKKKEQTPDTYRQVTARGRPQTSEQTTSPHTRWSTGTDN